MGWRSGACMLWSCPLLWLGIGCGDVGFDRPATDASADRDFADVFMLPDAFVDRQSPVGDAEVPDASVDAARSDAMLDASVDAAADALVEAGAGTCNDGVQNQSELFVDSGGPCSVRAPTCGEGVDPWTVGLFTFENASDTMVNDVTGTGDATIQNGPASYGNSATGCGMAWQGTGSAWLLAPNVASWKPAEGSLDFWLRVPNMSTETAMQVAVSRDASGNGNGHIVVAVTPEQRVAIRFQEAASEVYRCSAVLPAGTWVHVGVNWGVPDLELFIDGTETGFVGNAPFATSGSTVSCTTDTSSVGLDGNDEPWVFGANQWTSSAGTSDATSHYLKSAAAIDHVRISSVRRDFTR